VKLGQGDPIPATASGCFVSAVRAGRPARLAVATPTIEGAPIFLTYRSDATGAVEVTTDSRQDNLGERAIRRETCRLDTGTPTPDRLRFSGCSKPTIVRN
jgi:hypothetical protein